MNPSSQWTLFIARPGRDRQHVIRDPQGEPRIIFGEDDGTRINDHLARYIVEGLLWILRSKIRIRMRAGSWTGDGDEQDPAILICDPDFEILNTGSLEEDQAQGRKVVALINTYFIQNKASQPSASSIGSSPEKQ